MSVTHEPTSENSPSKNSREVRKLTIVSSLVLILFAPAILLIKLDAPYANYIALALTVSIIASTYVFFSLLELKLAAELMSLRSIVIIWLSSGGILLWFSKADAMANVNEIFGVDASLLPMTTAAATLIHAVMRLTPVLYLITGISALLFLLTLAAAKMRNEYPSYAVCHLANTFSFIVVSSLATEVMSLDHRRDQILYHLAHLSDFNSRSPCTNVNAQTDDVLYLDAAREKILVAPKIVEHEATVFSTFSLLASVPFSRDFRHLECVYRAEKSAPSASHQSPPTAEKDLGNRTLQERTSAYDVRSIENKMTI